LEIDKQGKQNMKLWKTLLAVPLGMVITAGALVVPSYAQAQSNTAQQPDGIKVFQTIEDKWSTAVVNPDQYTMDLLLDPSFVDITASGDVETRDEYIAFLFAKGGDQPFSMLQRVTSVREFGDTAVINGTYAIKVSVDGMPRDEQGVFTHVFEKTPAGWRCVNAQQTSIPTPKASAAKTKKRHRRLL
jgi:ketosteroid isomerase-like protein